MSDENKLKLYKLIAIRNSISLICFTILAIVFKTFYIVFISILFWCYSDEKENSTVKELEEHSGKEKINND